jgi:hypothetical protein
LYKKFEGAILQNNSLFYNRYFAGCFGKVFLPLVGLPQHLTRYQLDKDNADKINSAPVIWPVDSFRRMIPAAIIYIEESHTS